MKASDIKKGDIVRFKDGIFAVRHLQVQLPSSRGANTLYKMRLQDVRTQQNLEQTFKGDDELEAADFGRRVATFSYQDENQYVFMDAENYSEYRLDEEAIAEQLGYLSESLGEVHVLLLEDRPIGIQLPATVVLQIVETAPAMKGGTVTKRTKPATLETGLEVQVPEYLAAGESIKVNTQTGEYSSRA